MAGNNSSSIDTEIELVFVGLSLAGVSTIACIIALGVLLYYKMWRTFIYRLVLYLLISLMASSFATVGYSLFDYFLISNGNITLLEVNKNQTDFFVIKVIIVFSVNGSLIISSVFVTCINASITLMALRNYQFTYRSDLCLLALSILIGIISIIIMATIFRYTIYDHDEQIGVKIVASIFSAALLVNFIFATLTLVPLCCRACGYNLCMKTAATIESHRKALRGILPFFILIVPSFFFIYIHFGLLMYTHAQVYNFIIFSLPALVCAVSFALHLCFIRRKLKYLRPRSTRKQSRKYGIVTHNHNYDCFEQR